MIHLFFAAVRGKKTDDVIGVTKGLAALKRALWLYWIDFMFFSAISVG